MPHYLNLLTVNPLTFQVTEWSPLEGKSNIMLTGQHMHVQPIIARYSDNSVWVTFFDPEATEMRSYNLFFGDNLDNITIEEYYRVPVPHIPRPDTALAKMEIWKEQKINMKEYLMS